MKVFISWSGERSRKIAVLLKDWLAGVIQNLEIFISTQDIEVGSNWSNKISYELETTNVGIICLTKENYEKPWILFEAGALSKGYSDRACPLLIDFELSDLKPPLSNLHGATIKSEDFKHLLKNINSWVVEKRLSDETFEKVFENNISSFETDVKRILSETDDTKIVKRNKDDKISEMLTIVRNLDIRIKSIENNISLINKENVAEKMKERLLLKKVIADDNDDDSNYIYNTFNSYIPPNDPIERRRRRP